MAAKIKTTTDSRPAAQNPLILRAHRLMEAFAKSDDERDFFLDRYEGFLLFADLDKMQEDLEALEREIQKQPDRYCIIPKLTFYETKKIMEGFVNEKVYDIDTKEKLLDIIQSKEARENFLEFIYDHHSELEKWQQFYQERSRIRIIEWLRKNDFYFVFEEDLDLPVPLLEKLKENLFETSPGKDVQNARKSLVAKAKTYYSNEALNPRPKRGRPPKQVAKAEIEPQVSKDIYTTVPPAARPFLFTPDISSASSVTFSSRFDSEQELLASRRLSGQSEQQLNLESLNRKLESLRGLSAPMIDKNILAAGLDGFSLDDGFDDDDDDDDDSDDEMLPKSRPRPAKKLTPQAASKTVAKGAPKAVAKPLSKAAVVKKAKPKPKPKAPPIKRIMKPAPKAPAKAKPAAKSASKPKAKAKR